MANLRTWEVAKNNQHDISGIENPENWKYERVNGCFFPVEEIPTVEVNERESEMFDKLDPDMSNEEIEALGWHIKYESDYGDDNTVNFRENCGHANAVMI